MNYNNVSVRMSNSKNNQAVEGDRPPPPRDAVWVDPYNGDDNGTPVKTLAVAMARAATTASKTVVLCAGEHYHIGDASMLAGDCDANANAATVSSTTAPTSSKSKLEFLCPRKVLDILRRELGSNSCHL